MNDTVRDFLVELGTEELPPLALPELERAFADEHSLPEADVQMLAGIQFRGGQPRSQERWAHIYSAIRSTQWMDDE